MTHAAQDCHASIDPLGQLADLRAALGAVGCEPGALAQPSAELVSAAFEQMLSEHRGMADELLAVYEQLGIIFEVTRKLPGVNDEEEVIGLFLDSLERSFVERDVFVARHRKPDGWMRVQHCRDTGGEHGSLENQILTAIQNVCSGPRARTQVVNLCAGEMGISTLKDQCTYPHFSPRNGSGRDQALIGPVYSGDTLVCALVIFRRGETGISTLKDQSTYPRFSPAPEFRASDMSLVEALATFCGDLIRNHRLVREMREMSIAMVRSLVSAVDQKDQYTCGHSLRVGYYATTLGRLLKLPEIELQMLQWSALLHDVGKIGIRDDVLNKQGKLTPEEFQHIKEHPAKSHRVVQQVPQLADALDGILYHHERYDGTGYPSGLRGEAIPLQARIIQIADVFDALTSSRSYRPAYEWKEALDILRSEAGKTVDPHLQAVFDQHIRNILEGEPAAWQRLIEKANHFASAFESEESRACAHAVDTSRGVGL